MKKFLLVFASFIFSYNSAFAVNMVQIENYFQEPVSVVGLPDYPPFSLSIAIPRPGPASNRHSNKADVSRLKTSVLLSYSRE